MPTWSEYKEVAKSRGALAKEFYVARSTVVGTPDEMKAVLQDHFAYQAKLEAEGKLFMAGPLSDETGEMMEGMGQVIYRANSMEEARDLAANDPMHSTGVRTFVLRKWLVNEGSMGLSVSFAGQTVQLK